MGEAKRRGTRAERVAQAGARAEEQNRARMAMAARTGQRRLGLRVSSDPAERAAALARLFSKEK